VALPAPRRVALHSRLSGRIQLRIELLTIGDELLLGFTVDTNAAFLARTFAELGVEIVRRGTAGDDPDEIAAAVREALERTGAVITTGGLGPTADDRTRPAIARLFGRELVRDDAVLAQIEARFRRIGATRMPPINTVQAMVPVGARVLENHHGTAPGLWIEDERGRWVAMLPGVPREMRGLTLDTIVPLLRERIGASAPVVMSRALRTTGIGESALAERLGDLARGVEGLPLAFLPSWPGVDLRLTARGLPRAEATRVLDSAVRQLSAAAGPVIYGEEQDDLAALVLGLLRARGDSLATGESCTGGLLGARLTAIPGASDVYRGGIISYANDVKVDRLGVRAETLAEHGAVSEAVVREMAEGARRELGTSIGIGITGIAGPGGGTAQKPVGTVWIAVAGIGETRTLGRGYVGDREEIRLRATQAALDLVRRAVGAL
jgi:nicotinamide-nucleotide amidase